MLSQGHMLEIRNLVTMTMIFLHDFPMKATRSAFLCNSIALLTNI